ncbi:porin family protein, partial [Brumicola blandensis]
HEGGDLSFTIQVKFIFNSVIVQASRPIILIENNMMHCNLASHFYPIRKYMKTTLASLLLITATISSPAVLAAESPDWNFVEGSLEKFDIDDTDELAPFGFGLKGSYLLTDNIFIDGKYRFLTDDVDGSDFDITNFDINIGYRYGITRTTDIYGSIGRRSINVEVNDFEADDDGTVYKVGTRARLSDEIEVDASLAHERFGDFSDNTLSLSGHYYLNEQLALGAGVSTNDDGEQLSVSVRYSF